MEAEQRRIAAGERASPNSSANLTFAKIEAALAKAVRAEASDVSGLALSDESAEALGDQIANLLVDLIFDLSAVILDDAGSDILATADIPVDGTQYSVLRFRFDPIPIDKKIRAALRAGGFNVDEVRQSSSPVAGVVAATVGAGNRVSNGSAPVIL